MAGKVSTNSVTQVGADGVSLSKMLVIPHPYSRIDVGTTPSEEREITGEFGDRGLVATTPKFDSEIEGGKGKISVERVLELFWGGDGVPDLTLSQLKQLTNEELDEVLENIHNAGASLQYRMVHIYRHLNDTTSYTEKVHPDLHEGEECETTTMDSSIERLAKDMVAIRERVENDAIMYEREMRTLKNTSNSFLWMGLDKLQARCAEVRVFCQAKQTTP